MERVFYDHYVSSPGKLVSAELIHCNILAESNKKSQQLNVQFFSKLIEYSQRPKSEQTAVWFYIVRISDIRAHDQLFGLKSD